MPNDWVWKTGTSQNEYLAVPFAMLVGEVLIMEWIKIVYKKGKFFTCFLSLRQENLNIIICSSGAYVFQKARNDLKILGVRRVI